MTAALNDLEMTKSRNALDEGLLNYLSNSLQVLETCYLHGRLPLIWATFLSEKIFENAFVNLLINYRAN